MEKIDFKKALKHLYQPSKKKVEQVDVPEMNFIMVDGHGDPNTAQEYKEAMEALYGLAYTLKFKSKLELERDYTVPPLEGLWWADDMDAFLTGDKDQWDWTMMSMVPDWITPEMIETAKAELKAKKNPPRWISCMSRNSTKGWQRKSPISGRTPMKGPRSRRYTISSPSRASRAAENTTKSTSATRGVPRRKSCAPSSASR